MNLSSENSFLEGYKKASLDNTYLVKKFLNSFTDLNKIHRFVEMRYVETEEFCLRLTNFLSKELCSLIDSNYKLVERLHSEIPKE